MSEPATKNEAHENLIESFRAYLHTVIAAEQFGQSARLAKLPGPKTENYCASLAELPGNTLTGELANPVLAILKQIDQAARNFHWPLHQKKISDPAKQAEYERVLYQIDLALAFILFEVRSMALFRAKSTKSSDLICDAIMCAKGDGGEAARLIRRYQKEFPQNDREADGSIMPGSFPDQFAWDAYGRIRVLDCLADEYPDHVRVAARQMHGWPMLVHRHTSNKKRFQELAKRLELGVKYPLDASEGARFRPDTPLVRYLDPLISKIHYIRSMTANANYESIEKEREALSLWWWDCQGEDPSEDVVEVLQAVPKLPPLTKETANEWVEKVVVPVILATEARDWKNCEEPVLQRIAKQSGVKSRATFKSRLLSAVASTLRRLARPA